jgi:signal transduction histidine kinase
MKVYELFKILILTLSFSFSSTAQNLFTFSNLPGSKHYFYLIDTNSDGKLSETFAVINLIFQTPFWESWWFIALLIFAFILIAYLIHLIVIKSTISKVVELNRKKEEESKRIIKKTSADYYDELGHRLTRISILTELIKRKLGYSFNELKPMLDQISENSSKLSDGAKDFFWAMDSNRNTLYEVMVRLKDFGDEIFSNSNMNFNVEGISDDLQNVQLSMNWKRDLILIFKEGISNSFQHSKSSNVSLILKINGNELEIILEDDGNGFELNKKYKGTGLKNIKQRAADLKANIQILTKPGEGMKILLKGKIPVN